MGKRRNAAKTGDKKLYASRNATKDTGERSPKDFDTFHTEREESYLGLDVEDPRYDDDDDDRFDGQHNVLDLAMAGDDSDSKSDDSSADDSSAEENWKQDPGEMVTSTNASFSDEASETDEDDETDALDRLDVRGWGRKKSSYYDGDLADLELGVQAEDDAVVEEEAARDVQHSRLIEMHEDDFVPSDDEEVVNPPSPQKSPFDAVRDTTTLKARERRQLLKLRHPEFLPVTSYFSTVLKEYVQTTKVAIDTLIGKNELDPGTAKSVGTSCKGQQLLLTKSLAEQSAILNTVLYLLLKAATSEDGDPEPGRSTDTHPVMLQLKRSNDIMDTLYDNIVKNDLKEQIQHLVKAASLAFESTNHDTSDRCAVVEGDEENPEDKDRIDNEHDLESRTELLSPGFSIGRMRDSSSQQRVLGAARFGLRQHEILVENSRKRRSTSFSLDFGVESGEARNTNELASAINAIHQRRAKRIERSRALSFSEGAEYDEDGVAMGVRMMTEELERERLATEFPKDSDDGLDVEKLDSTDFYGKIARKAREKKLRKEQMHSVAPKFPTFEGDVEGERAITRAILKNRGLVPHKSRANRNPRVKKRLAYERAVQNRKGIVRDVRTDQGRYDGEGTGIKTRISTSRKLIS